MVSSSSAAFSYFTYVDVKAQTMDWPACSTAYKSPLALGKDNIPEDVGLLMLHKKDLKGQIEGAC